MSMIAYKIATPPEGAVTKMFSRFFAGLRARFVHDPVSGMSEREFQDIGWGQMDRYSRAASLDAWRRTP